LINIGAVIGVLPVTGIPLPFISFGGSSLVITMAAAGILINIARQEKSPAKSGQRQPHGTIALPRRGSERMTVGSTSGRGRGQ
jgi:cell division protein FtsW